MAKSKRSAEDQRLTRVSRIRLRLPQATRRNSGSHASFLVRKETFASFLNDHHGDKIVSVARKALPGDSSALAAAQPGRFIFRLSSDQGAGSRCVSILLSPIGKRWPNGSLAPIA